MTLYEMTAQAAELYALLGAEEIDEQTVADTIEAMGVGDKLEDYCKVIRQFEADATAFENEKKRFEKKQKRAENAVFRLKRAIQNYMTVSAKDEEQCGMFTVKVSRTKVVDVTDENMIPALFRKPQPDTIDKAGIRKALFAGEEVAGATLKVNESLNIK
jgi:hypothetical protein